MWRALGAEDWVIGAPVATMVRVLLLIVALPLYAILAKSLENHDGAFVGLANYLVYFETPALADSLSKGAFVSLLSMAIVIPLAFVYA